MEDGRCPFPSHIDDMRRPFIDYVHRATVLSILGLAVRTRLRSPIQGWGLWLTGAVYVSRIGNTDRVCGWR